jgi:hypothetical protein
VDLETKVADLEYEVHRRFFGMYRGTVVENADPSRLGRLRTQVPSVAGDAVLGWATPCVPYGGAPDQGLLLVPDAGAGVWIGFEEGNPDYPIWFGAYWSQTGGDTELPKPNGPDGAEQGGVQDPPTRKILKTAKGHTIQFEDKDSEELITLVEAVNHNVVTMNKDGITVTDGANGNKITMGADGVTVQTGGAVKVGSSNAKEPFVLGKQFDNAVKSFLNTLNTHVHTGNLGAPTTPPAAPMSLSVPLSPKHLVE